MPQVYWQVNWSLLCTSLCPTQVSPGSGQRSCVVTYKILPGYIYGSCTKRNLNRLQRVVNFGARVIAGRKKRDSVQDILRDLKWLSVTQLHSYHALCLIKRLLDNNQPMTLARRLVRRSEVRPTQTRQNNDIDLPAIRTEYGRHRLY